MFAAPREDLPLKHYMKKGFQSFLSVFTCHSLLMPPFFCLFVIPVPPLPPLCIALLLPGFKSRVNHRAWLSGSCFNPSYIQGGRMRWNWAGFLSKPLLCVSTAMPTCPSLTLASPSCPLPSNSSQAGRISMAVTIFKCPWVLHCHRAPLSHAYEAVAL